MRRLERIVAKLKNPWANPSPEQLRVIRALEALERCGTAEARAVLSALAKGAEGAYVTEEAQAALRRWGKRP